MKKFITLAIVFAVLIANFASLTSYAAINVNNGIYVPAWTAKWVPEGTAGMWKGFYIAQADNVLKTDLINGGGGEWKVAGDNLARVWEGLNIVQPSDDTDVGYLFTAIEAGKVEFTMVGKLDQPTSTDIEISAFKNTFNTKLYPTNAASLVAKKGVENTINFVIDLAKNEKVFFLFHSPVESADSDQYRFTTFQAVYRSLGTGGGATTTAKVNGTTASTNNSTTAGTAVTNASSTDATAVTTSSGEVVIDDTNSFPIKSKFEDIKIDETALTLTLSKKLTVKDFFDSFTLNSGYTIKLYNTDASQVTDTTLVVTDKMIARVYNKETPVNVLKIVTTYKEVSATPVSNNNAIFIVLGIVLLLAIAGAVYFFVIRKKKGMTTK